MNMLNIVFAGTPEFGLPCLEALAASEHHLAAIYTQPDRPAGRGRKLQPSAVKRWAEAHYIPVFQPLNFKSEEAVATLAALKPDLLVVIAYGLILPASVLAIPRFGCVNVHASLLPRWRGASPVQQAILQGDSLSGVTIMQMDTGLDTGDSLAEVSCAIDDQDTAGILQDKLALLAPQPLITTIEALAAGQSKRVPQDSQQATYASKINKEDARINWQESALKIDRQIRAFNPWPVAFTKASEHIMRIHQAVPEPGICNAEPGTILALEKQGMLVATGDGLLRIKTVQFPGGKAMSVADWLNAGRGSQFIDLVLQ